MVGAEAEQKEMRVITKTSVVCSEVSILRGRSLRHSRVLQRTTHELGWVSRSSRMRPLMDPCRALGLSRCAHTISAGTFQEVYINRPIAISIHFSQHQRVEGLLGAVNSVTDSAKLYVIRFHVHILSIK